MPRPCVVYSVIMYNNVSLLRSDSQRKLCQICFNVKLYPERGRCSHGCCGSTAPARIKIKIRFNCVLYSFDIYLQFGRSSGLYCFFSGLLISSPIEYATFVEMISLQYLLACQAILIVGESGLCCYPLLLAMGRHSILIFVVRLILRALTTCFS